MLRRVVIETPALIHLGAQKTASTWFARCLQQHEVFRFSFLKEVHYFSQVLDGRASGFLVNRVRDVARQRLASGALKPPRQRYIRRVSRARAIGTDRWYRNLFTRQPEIRRQLEEGRPTVLCDFTPAYMTMPAQGFDHMRRLLPNAHYLLVVRDPVRRMVSGFTMGMNINPELASASEPEQLNNLQEQQLPRGDYRHVIGMLERLALPHTVVAFRDLVETPEQVLQGLERTFGLAHQPVDFGQVEKVNSHSGTLPLSDVVQARIRQSCEPQYAFLRERFGESFLSRI